MTNNIAITDDMNAVQRWENEGGKMSPFDSVWIWPKSFKTERNSRERQVIDSQKSFRQQPGDFSEFNVRRVV